MAGVGFWCGVENIKDPFAGGAAGLDDLVELVEASDRFVKEADKDEKGDENAEVEFALEGGPAAVAEDDKAAQGGKEIHPRVVESPGAHHDEGGLAELFARGVEAFVFGGLPGIAFDLPDTIEIIMEEGVEVGSGAALRAIAFAGGEGVSEGAGHKEGHRAKGAEGEGWAPPKHETEDDSDLQDGDGTLFNAVDEDTFDTAHVLDHASHDVAGGAVVEPSERQGLEPAVKIAAQIVEDALLEAVVEEDAERVESVLGEEAEGCESDHRPEGLGFAAAQHIVNDALGDHREDDDHDGGAKRAEQGGRGEQRVAAEIGKDSGEDTRGLVGRHWEGDNKGSRAAGRDVPRVTGPGKVLWVCLNIASLCPGVGGGNYPPAGRIFRRHWCGRTWHGGCFISLTGILLLCAPARYTAGLAGSQAAGPKTTIHEHDQKNTMGILVAHSGGVAFRDTSAAGAGIHNRRHRSRGGHNR